MATVGIHVIWTTYMTWLPGDPRGHWSPLFDFYGHLIRKGHRLNLPDVTTRTYAESLAKEPPKILNPGEITVVSDTLGELLYSPAYRPGNGNNKRTPAKAGAICWAAAIEPNHVHLLLGPLTEDLGRFVGRLKGMSSSEVLALPENAARKRTWTAGFWKVFLFDEEAVVAVKEYVEAHNVRRGLPAAPFGWITPI